MELRELGTTGVKVSAIGLGCWTMGGLNWVNGNPNGWADPDENEIAEGIKLALDRGVNHWDNADVYGNGRAERMLARVFDRLGVSTNEQIIATKVGHFPGTAEHAYRPEHIRHQAEQSLVNLRRDHLDVYYFHHGDFGASDMYLDDAASVMDDLVAQGKVRVKGQSAYSAADFERVTPRVRPAVLQSWAHALDDQFIREGSPVQALMEREGMSFVAFSPLAQARLLDKFDPENPPTFEAGDHREKNSSFQPDALRELKPKLAKLKTRFGESTTDLAAMALGYVLAHPRVASAIPGFRNARQVEANLSGVGRAFSGEDVAFVRESLV